MKNKFALKNGAAMKREFCLRRKRTLAWVVLGFCAGLGASGMWGAWQHFQSQAGVLIPWWPDLLLMQAGFLGLAVWFRLLLGASPLARGSAEGLSVKEWGGILVPWEDVADCSLAPVNGSAMNPQVVVWVRNASKHLAGTRWAQMLGQERLGAPRVALSALGLEDCEEGALGAQDKILAGMKEAQEMKTGQKQG